MRILNAMSARDRRALIIGGALVVPALLFAGVIRPWLLAEAALRANTSAQRDLLERERDLLAAGDLTGQIRAAQLTLATASRRLYTAPEPVSATAALARDVRRALEDAGLETQRLEARESDVGGDGLRQLTVEINAEGDLEGVLTALSSLEAGPKLIRVRRLAIDRASAASATPMLGLSATVSGYMR
jgi:hypothetical protein